MTRRVLLALSAVLASAGAWRAPRPAVRARASRMAAVRMYETPITISGNNVELTEAMKAYVDEKVGAALSKFVPMVSRCDAHLSVIRNARVAQGHTCEVVCFSKGAVIRAAERSESMYSSIDLVAAKLARKLRKLKERRQDKGDRVPTNELFEADEPAAVDEPVLDAASVVRTKRFQMPPQTLEDAIVCLEYVDHPFYVFRNSASGEINVIYKRNEGGIGLIEPDK